MVTKVLFVCMGNICRPPTAQGVFEQLIKEWALESHFEVDSAGTHDYHVGENPDERAQMAANRRGIDISQQRARMITREDFAYFDYVLAMDKSNLQCLKSICPANHQKKLELLMIHSKDYPDSEVPDPYYGGDTGFENVLDLITSASKGFLSGIFPEKGFESSQKTVAISETSPEAQTTK